MTHKIYVVFLVMLLASCGLFSGGPDPKPEPTHAILEIQASDAINPDIAGRASPVALRIYELKSLSGFNEADFLSIYDEDKTVLGGDLISKKEVVVKPNENLTLHIEASGETQAVGLFAAFRNFDQGQWRSAVPLPPHKTSVIKLYIHGVSLSVQ